MLYEVGGSGFETPLATHTQSLSLDQSLTHSRSPFPYLLIEVNAIYFKRLL